MLRVERAAHRRLTGAYSAISLRSEPSSAKRTTITPPGSTPVTTPSPKAACTTSSPIRNVGADAASRPCAPARPPHPPDGAPPPLNEDPPLPVPVPVLAPAQE